jgi:pantothenate kinase
LQQLNELVSRIVELGDHERRAIIAIAGPPGSGKSFLSERTCKLLPPGSAQVVPMDGFHYDNAILDELGLRNRKGAPETFDFDGFETNLKRIRHDTNGVAVPVFDRPIDLSRASARLIRPETRYILVEGNYLLLGEAPWSGLRPLFDFSIFIDVPRAELELRLVKRWLDLGHSEASARAWVENNDMKNVDLVLASRQRPDFTWHFD